MINLLEIRRDMEALDHYRLLGPEQRADVAINMAKDLPNLMKLVLDMKKTLEFSKATLEAALKSKKAGGKGISKEYLSESIESINVVLDQIKS